MNLAFAGHRKGVKMESQSLEPPVLEAASQRETKNTMEPGLVPEHSSSIRYLKSCQRFL